MIVTFGTGKVVELGELVNDGMADVCCLVLQVENKPEIKLPFKVWSGAAVHMVNNVSVGDTLTFKAEPRKENGELFFKITEYQPHESNRAV